MYSRLELVSSAESNCHSVFAMYSRNRNLLYALSTFLFVEVCCMVGVLSVTIPEFQMTEGCIVTLTPRLFSFYW